MSTYSPSPPPSIAPRADRLYTFNAQCSEADWPTQQQLLRGAALSFRLIDPQ